MVVSDYQACWSRQKTLHMWNAATCWQPSNSLWSDPTLVLIHDWDGFGSGWLVTAADFENIFIFFRVCFSYLRYYTHYTQALSQKKKTHTHSKGTDSADCVSARTTTVEKSIRNVCLLALWLERYPSYQRQHWLTGLDCLGFMGSSLDLSGGSCSAKEKGIKFTRSLLSPNTLPLMNSCTLHGFVHLHCSREEWSQRKGRVGPKRWALWKNCWYFSSWPWLRSPSPSLSCTSWTKIRRNRLLWRVSVCSVEAHWSSAQCGQKNVPDRNVCSLPVQKWSNP